MRRVKRNPWKGGFRTFPEARKKRPASRGFTIIEVAIIVLIFGILAVIAVPAYRNYIYGSQLKLSISHIRLLEQGIAIYLFENGTLPDNLGQVKPAPSQTLPSLDPWGNPYQYLNLLTDNYPTCPNARRDRNNHPLNPDFDLYSMGADGRTVKPVNQSFGKDDIIRADSGKFVDLGANY